MDSDIEIEDNNENDHIQETQDLSGSNISIKKGRRPLIMLHVDSVFPMNKGEIRLRLLYQVEYLLVKNTVFSTLSEFLETNKKTFHV